MTTNEPIRRFQAGQISCALWRNEVTINGKPQAILKASCDRRYLGRDGQWRNSQSFSRNDIPLVIYVMQKAFEAMIEASKTGPESDEAVDEEAVV